MDDPTTTDSTGDRRTTGVEPGDRRKADLEPGDRPANRSGRLDRPPSERYASTAAPEAIGRRDRAARALGVTAAGAATVAFLGGPLSMTVGLLAVSVVIGLVLGAMLRPATAVAVSLAVGSVVVGLLGVWLFARTEGGVLDPLTYLAEVEGPVAPIQLVLAALGAIVSSR